MIHGDDPKMAIVVVVSGAIHGALCAALVLVALGGVWAGARSALRSSIVERWLNSGHYRG